MQKTHSRILSCLVLFMCATTCAWGSPPSWWSDSTNGTAILNGNATNNLAPVTLGQLKFVAAQAKSYLDTQLSSKGGSGPVINAIVNNFAINSTFNLSPVVAGQLKYVTKPFYDRLQAVGYDTQANLNSRITDGWSHIYPWPDPPPRPDQVGYDADNYTAWLNQQYVPVNLGQLKLAFSFDLTGFTPTGGNISGNSSGNITGPSSGNFLGHILTSPWDGGVLSGNYSSEFLDWVTAYQSSNTSFNPGDPNVGNEDPDGDGVVNYMEWLLGTDPTKPDTDADGVNDGSDALGADADFTMYMTAVPNYTGRVIGNGKLTDVSDHGTVLIDQTTRDGNGDIVSGSFKLWINGLIDAPSQTEEFDPLSYLWTRIDDSERVLGFVDFEDGDPVWWRPGMESPIDDGGRSYLCLQSNYTYTQSMDYPLYADKSGNIYMDDVEWDSDFNYTMGVAVWNVSDNSVSFVGETDQGPVQITLATAWDSSDTPHTLAIKFYEYGSYLHNSLLIDDTVVADDVDWDCESLIAYSDQFSVWEPQPVLGGDGNHSLVYVAGGVAVDKDLTDDAQSSTPKTITSLNQRGMASTGDGLLWVNGLTQNVTDGQGAHVFLDMVSSNGNFAVGHYGNTGNMDNSTNLVLLQQIPDFYNVVWPQNVVVSSSEFSGATHRKIALNGRPLPDGKPQTAPESDRQPEETFIDALTQSLRHNVTDIYSTVAGTDLPLSVNRVYGEEIWATDQGLQPTVRNDWPFGPGWRSNIAPDIVLEDKGGSLVDAYVTDEDGDEYHFVGGNITVDYDTRFRFVPYPSSRHEKKTYLATLTLTGNASLEGNATLTLQKKYGTTVTYNYTSNISQAIQSDASVGNETFRFYRADNVEDHLGNKLQYGYADSLALVPSNLTMHDVSGNLIPGEYMNITFVSSADNGIVHNITDSDGKTTTYAYGNFTDSAGCSTAKLTSVEDAAGGNVTYGYQMTPEMDNTPHAAGYTGPFPIFDHLELSSITDQNGNEYQFESDFPYDEYWTKGFMNHSLIYGYYPVFGHPRIITQVTLPDSSQATFDGDILVKTYGGGGDFTLTTDSHRVLNVTDADGRTITYTWSGAQVVPMDVPYQLQSQQPDSDPCVVLYTAMTVDYGNTYGNESFVFEPEAGMALSMAVDIGGAVTSYRYDDQWTAPAWYAQVLPSVSDIVGYYDDPTSQTDADGGVEKFAYDPANSTLRLMSDIWDKNDHLTHYDFNSNGLRTAEKHYDGDSTSSTLEAETDYTYGNTTNFPGVATEREVKKGSGDPGWASNLTVDYTLSNAGRVITEVVDPGNLALTTEHGNYTDPGYSNTGDLLSTTDPRGNVTTFTYDDRHRLVSTTYPGSVSRNYTYDARGNELTETDELGHATVNKYDELNRLVSSTRVLEGSASNITSGIATAYTYNHTNARLSVTSPDGSTVSGNGTVTTDASYTTTYVYDDLNRLIEMDSPPVPTDGGSPASLATTYSYDGDYAGGSVFDSSSFKPTSVTDPRGYVSYFEYDGLGHLLSQSVEYDFGSDYANVSNSYDPEGNLLERDVDLGSNVTMSTAFTYDALNRLTMSTFADGTNATANYTATGLLYQKTDELGRVTETEYDAAGRATEVIFPDLVTSGSTGTANITTTYDANGNPYTVTDARGNLTTYTYDARNRRTVVTEPAVPDWSNNGTSTSPVIHTYYDDVGNPYRVTDATGNDTYTEYDAANRAVWSFTPAVSYWNGTGNVSGVYLATKNTYDAEGNVLDVQQGYATAQSSANATLTRNTTTNIYDALNRLLSTEDAANITVAFEYDEGNNRSLVTDGLGQNTTFDYDGLNRVTNITDALGNSTVYTYGPTHVDSMIYANGNGFGYEYDSRDRKIYDGMYSYVYDNAGELILAQLYSNSPEVAGYDYDYTFWPDVAYAYDGMGRVIAENQGGVDNDTYLDTGDDIERGVFGSISENITGGHTNTFTYDANGNRLSVTYDDGEAGNRTLNTGYDALNRVSNITDVTSGNLVTGYHYDLAGRRLELLQANSGNIWTSYDALGRQTAITGNRTSGNTTTTPYSLALAYDEYNNLALQAETYNGTLHNRSLELGYDGANRLTEELSVVNSTTTGSNGTAHWTTNLTSTYTSNYTFDNASNRLTLAEVNSTFNSTATTINATNVTTTANNTSNTNVANITYHYDAANELNYFNDTVGSVTTNLTYDAAGDRLTFVNTTANYTYQYDGHNRLDEVLGNVDSYGTWGSEPVEYSDYDYQGRRIVHQHNTYTTNWDNPVTYNLTIELYDGDGAVRADNVTYDSFNGYDGTTHVADYVRGSDWGGGIGGILYSVPGGGNGTNTAKYYHYDARGDVIALTSNTGAIAYQADYNAYGFHGSIAGTQSAGTNSDPFQANTKEEDPDGLLDEGQRYRDLVTNVFLTRDPLGMAGGGPNFYTYVNQNPWSKVDPEGLFWATTSDNHLEWGDPQANNAPTKYTDYGAMNKGGTLTKSQLEAVQGRLKSLLGKVGPENSVLFTNDPDIKNTLGLLLGYDPRGVNVANGGGYDSIELLNKLEDIRGMSNGQGRNSLGPDMDQRDVDPLINYSTGLYNNAGSQFQRDHPGLVAGVTSAVNGFAYTAIAAGSMCAKSSDPSADNDLGYSGGLKTPSQRISENVRAYMRGDKPLSELTPAERDEAAAGYDEAAVNAKSAADASYQRARAAAVRGNGPPPGSLLDWRANYKADKN